MCRSMVDIQSATAEIKRGIKKKVERNHRAKNIMSASATQGGHKEEEEETTQREYNVLPYSIGRP